MTEATKKRLKTIEQRTAWQELSGETLPFSTEQVVMSFQNYVASYDKQEGYASYPDNVIVEDMLYGLGIALDPEKYKFVTGYTQFKKDLLKVLSA